MQNRVHVFDEFGNDDGHGSVDERPTLRLASLGLLMALPLIVVAGRLAHLQVVIGTSIVRQRDFTTESVEPIPSRDGRILGRDGRVLAHDAQRFRVLAHYRSIEDPPDRVWLRRQAYERLTPRERRRPESVDAAERAVLAERDAMWSRLAAVTDSSPAALLAERRAVQRRVERIVERVEAGRRRRASAVEAPDPATEPESVWGIAWSRLSRTLATPPRRARLDPLVIREELDHHEIVRDVPFEVAAHIESAPHEFPGLRVEVVTTREYPAGALAPHVVGVRRPIDADDVTRRAERFPNGDPLDLEVGDRSGRSGVERSYDHLLHGLRGERRVVRDRNGEVVSSEIVRRPRVGRDVLLTLDLELQERCARLLDDALEHGVDSSSDTPTIPDGAALVVLDVHTGAVRVAASAPRFDLRDAADPQPERWRELLADSRQPFFPRCLRMTVAPGSVFKTLTSVALLQNGSLNPETPFFCQGFLDSPNRNRCYVYTHYGVGHGDVDLSDAICRSCNVYFFAAARAMGPRPVVEWADRFGFGKPTGIDLPGERGGTLPSPDRRRHGEPWYPGDTLGLAIGQSRLTVTPLQVARMMAAIANGGQLVTPHVARPVPMPGEARHELPPSRPIRGLKPGTIERIREGLKKVVADPRGTGYKRVRLEEVAIAGKTGTAEVGPGKNDHAWFAGYVPADEPRYAFCIVLEHAGSGGRAAGPIARRLVQEMLDVGMLSPMGTGEAPLAN